MTSDEATAICKDLQKHHAKQIKVGLSPILVELQCLRTELKSESVALHLDFKTEMQGLRVELSKKFNILLGLVATELVANVAMFFLK